MIKKTELIKAMSVAIGMKEGFFVTPEQYLRQGKKLPKNYVPGQPMTLAQKNNNPGNLRMWKGVPQIGGFAFFGTLENGWEALRQQIETNIYGKGSIFPLRRTKPMSFLEFFAGQRDAAGNVLPGGYPGYAPALDGNAPTVYARFVVSHIRANSSLSSLPEAEQLKVTIDTVILKLIGTNA